MVLTQLVVDAARRHAEQPCGACLVALCPLEGRTDERSLARVERGAEASWIGVEETRREMGNDFWPYGLDANRHVLETFLRYSYEQGLAKELLPPERLFAAESLEAFRI